ncbi:hypothetical protein BOV88_12865 [Solemya velum gill symbiont]|uniref:Uncharacterized protein n=1 Tax=Solemya velum gill symbiont TaxID=2340 RepID=A0A1T2DFC2_SOVGS|nr:hypothetical protein BOV88_12865 [Solemya velum gill symbiont]OOY45788.1 hypothetical protein BOV93_12230 [Solemya velum gill symbiont]
MMSQEAHDIKSTAYGKPWAVIFWMTKGLWISRSPLVGFHSGGAKEVKTRKPENLKNWKSGKLKSWHSGNLERWRRWNALPYPIESRKIKLSYAIWDHFPD